MPKVKSLGTTITFNSKTVNGLTSIGEVTPDSEEIDVTSLDSAGGYREFLQGFKDSGEIALSGYHISGDEGQAELRTGYGSGEAKAAVITFPSAAGTVTFTAYVKSYTMGAAEVDGAVGFGATLRITGAVTVA